MGHFSVTGCEARVQLSKVMRADQSVEFLDALLQRAEFNFPRGGCYVVSCRSACVCERFKLKIWYFVEQFIRWSQWFLWITLSKIRRCSSQIDIFDAHVSADELCHAIGVLLLMGILAMDCRFWGEWLPYNFVEEKLFCSNSNNLTDF